MTVTVDLVDLVEAMEDASASLNYFVDRETGDIVLVSDTLGFIEAGYQRIEMAKSRDRYVPVPISAISDYSGDLESFIDELTEVSVSAELEEALDALEPRKRVESILANHPEIATSWMTFRNERTKSRAVEWLMRQEMTANTSS